MESGIIGTTMKRAGISVVIENSEFGLSSVFNREVRKRENSGWRSIMNSLLRFYEQNAYSTRVEYITRRNNRQH